MTRAPTGPTGPTGPRFSGPCPAGEVPNAGRKNTPWLIVVAVSALLGGLAAVVEQVFTKRDDPIVPPMRAFAVRDTAWAVPTVIVPNNEEGEPDLHMRVIEIGGRVCVVAWLSARVGPSLAMDCEKEIDR